jgi:hypothetical protein
MPRLPYRELPSEPPFARQLRFRVSLPAVQRQKEASVHAVVVKVTIKDVEAAEEALREQVVPRISQAPGFVTGYWTRKGSGGLSMLIFESEDAANTASEMVRAGVPDAVTLDDVEVRQVAAHA